MEMLTKSHIASGLRSLGLDPGDKVLVHSSLSALGRVEDGAEAVIDALLEAVGPEGLVVVPTFGGPQPFDRRTTPTTLGVIADRFWRRPDAVRSLHPTHSVAAIGKGAEELIRDHEKAPTAYAEGTPYHRLTQEGGKILLLGVDQDRNTTMHTAEALSGAVYLTSIQGTYIDDSGQAVTIDIAAMAGPHRNFIGLDPLFRERGVTRMGRIGKAVCRLMDSRMMLEVALEALRHDPAAVLCNNPACSDCVMQRGRIKAARLAEEDFTLAADFGDIISDEGVDEVVEAIKGEGISSIEMTARHYREHGETLAENGISIAAIQAPVDDIEAAELAAQLGVPVIVPVGSIDNFDEARRLARDTSARVLMMNNGAPSGLYEDIYDRLEDAPELAFNPGAFAWAGEMPFLEVFYRGVLRRRTAHLYLRDGTVGYSTLPGEGKGEVKEIISILRCRGFDGVMTLGTHEGGIDGFRRSAAAFWRMLDEM